VRFAPSEPGITLLGESGHKYVWRETQTFRRFYVLTPERVATYTPICTGGCDTQLERGEYEVGLAEDDSDHVVPAGSIDIDGPSVVHAELVDHHASRTVGVLLGAAGVATGLVLVMTSLRDDGVSEPTFAIGASTVAVSALVGVLFGLQKDSARVTVSPLAF
jgi:hypothetical protein